MELVREEVANFIQERDGYSASADDIFLTNGASSGVEVILKVMIRGPDDGVLLFSFLYFYLNYLFIYLFL